MSEDTIFSVAIEILSSEERAQYLTEACAGDEDLLSRLEILLQAHENPDPFLEPPHHTTASLPTPSQEEVGIVIGPYKLMEQLSDGGMGVVFVAEQEKPVRRQVALKIIKPGMDSKQVIARFEAERQALALMDHPNIARVFDGGTTENGRPYFVMELVRGVPITEYCDKAKLGIRDRLQLFVKVCKAVQHAHQKGIIHRDLKPSNVMITVLDEGPVPKVIDFGVAKAINQRLTEHTLYTTHAQMIGTPMYMSPEQANMSGVDVDTRSDVYSLGVMLFELLSGSTPFDKETLKQAGFDRMRRIIREEEPPRLSSRLEDRVLLSTFVVDSTADTVNSGDGVTTLREAILDANANPGTDAIEFDIPTADPGYSPTTNSFTIGLTSSLPTITEAVLIDGSSQPGFSGSPIIELDGSLAGSVNGLSITGNNSVIRGLVINRFSGVGVLIGSGGSGNVIEGNYIGTDVTGSIARGNRTGTVALANGSRGVQISGCAKSNLIGTDGDGVAETAERNMISGNASMGVLINGNGTDANVAANFIRTDFTGTVILGNASTGVQIQNGARFNVIGTNGDGMGDHSEGNVISANLGVGVSISATGTDHNAVAGNFIGTDFTGSLDLGNEQNGIQIVAGAQSNTIGVHREQINFTKNEIVPVGDLPRGVTTGDVDGDGDNDVIVANAISDDINVMFNNGDGSFGSELRFAVGNFPHAVTMGDFDGDGDLDVVTANHNSNDVTVLFNNGDGTFAGRVDLAVVSRPRFVAVGDLDGDGSLDLAVGNAGSDKVSVLLNNGNGTFAAAVNYTAGTGPWHLLLDDFDADGDLDLAVANGFSSDVSILLNQGNGVFSAPTHFAVGVNPLSLTSGDFDNDGDLDVVTGDFTSHSLSILLNLGNGSFAAAINVPLDAGLDVVAVQAADFDDDGNLDLVVLNYSSGSLSVLRNGGNATFTLHDVRATGEWPRFIAIADLDGDSNLDLAVINENSDDLSVLLNVSNTVDPVDQRNVISGNGHIGVLISGNGTDENSVAGNFIGADASGMVAISNGRDGVLIDTGASDNRIGTDGNGVADDAEANIIAFNTLTGGGVASATSTGNAIRGNSIHSNTGLGIDLLGNGVTLNDSGDSDTSPNNLQNFPVFSQIVAGATTLVIGSLNSTPNTTFIIDLYANTIAGPAGYGEGERYLGKFTVSTDATGNVSFVRTLIAETTGGELMTATATNPNGNTSEFSLGMETVQELFGTKDNDHFLVEAGTTSGEIKVTRTNPDGAEVFHLTSSEIYLYGLGGDDTFIVNGLPTGELHLDEEDQDEAFELNATSGGAVSILGHAGDDDVIIDATSASGATVDLGAEDDDYLVNLGNLLGIESLSDSGASGSDDLNVNGTNNPDVINKTDNQITLGNPITETIDFTGMDKIKVNGRGGNDKIEDPGTNTTLLGGLGDDTFIINASFGKGVVVDGEEGADIIFIELGDLAGPVTISDSGTTGTTTILIIGTDAVDQMTLSATQLTSNGEIINLDFTNGDTHLIIDGGDEDDLVTIDGALPDGVTIDLVSIAQTVQIDVKPSSNTNTVNLAAKGVLPVVIYATAGFDASTVDIGTVIFAGASVAQYAFEDVDGDGDLDLVLHFRIQEMVDLAADFRDALADDLADNGVLDDNHQNVTVTLKGRTIDGKMIEGSDTIDAFFAGKALREALNSL